MKNLILALLALSSYSAFADTVSFDPSTDGSATLTIQGEEAEKLYAAMKNVKKYVATGQHPGFGSASTKPFSGVQCTQRWADRLPPLYSCIVKFYNVENGIPDSR